MKVKVLLPEAQSGQMGRWKGREWRLVCYGQIHSKQATHMHENCLTQLCMIINNSVSFFSSYATASTLFHRVSSSQKYYQLLKLQNRTCLGSQVSIARPRFVFFFFFLFYVTSTCVFMVQFKVDSCDKVKYSQPVMLVWSREKKDISHFLLKFPF